MRLGTTTAKRYLLPCSPRAPTVSVLVPLPVPVSTQPPPLTCCQHTSLTGELRHTLRGHSSNVFGVAISPKGDYIVSGSYDRTIRIWDPASGMYAQHKATRPPPPSTDPPARVGLGLGTSPPYFEVDNRQKKKVSGPFEAVGGRHDPLKLIQII